ncbi:3-deoxy-7-phosphoheptulonate synthase [Plantactinospora sp. B24E8]|uniref:3-deoxy-7-phosphoheptulonate synthase n=1 Tax=Plantactinospora sp. B24E8 TaxID=3153567 RepID=UPI00325CE948
MIGEQTLTRPGEFATELHERELDYLRLLPAEQQPAWTNEWLAERVRADLAGMPPLVGWNEVRGLRRALAEVAAGRLLVIQAGDCAEDPAECTPGQLSYKVGLLDALAGVLRTRTGQPVLRVGRIAGQFAKPRTRPTEIRHGIELPVFRGMLINGPEPDPVSRRPDPLRMLSCHRAAGLAVDYLWHTASWAPDPTTTVWTSHEALVLDYELPQLRRLPDGRLLLTSAHWPWIGDRTRQLDGAHVRLLSSVANPVACKVGPGTGRGELRELCARLDPRREPGRLTLIARLGADLAARRLPELVTAVRDAGHPVIWLCDPMHGNTVTARDGRKTRLLEQIVQEVRAFRRAVAGAGGTAGGLHLETTPHDVTECVPDADHLDRVGDRYTSLCDPRLNPEQALRVAASWT